MIRSSRIGLAHSALALFAVAILIKAGRVQLVDGGRWRARAERQQVSEREVPAPRGEILDATGRVLAQSRDMVRLEIAPREVNEPAKLRRELAKLGVEPAVIRRALNPSGKYVVVPDRFLAVDAAPAMSLRGVHAFATIMRSYALSRGGQGIVGQVDADNKPTGGLELSLDTILRGVPGTATIFRDPKGQAHESPIAPGTAPTKGNTIQLTINADLQEIAEKALADAIAKMGAEGGDIVVLDPNSGEIRAMASRRLDPREISVTAITEPFEPGSTAKPFIAAGLLDRKRVADHDSVDTGNGVLMVEGRSNPIRDDHLVGKAPLADVLRWSSNIGIVKFSQRLSNREEFETLRDFGFGTPTGLPYPVEASGTLRPPSVWSTQSHLSLAMGYEISVTPLQLASAYAVFANGGELVEPALVKQVIGPDGSIRYRHERRVVRRVIAKATADKVRHLLLDVVDEGTALKAALDNFLLAGKTGTPRSTVRGRYVAGRYNPNFVSIFPADNPQYVIVVKLTAPRSSIYAAETAAPVTKAIVEAAVVARDAALDRTRLAASVVPTRTQTARPITVQQGGEVHEVAERTEREIRGDSAIAPSRAPYIVTLPFKRSAQPERVERAVPDVRGLDLRDAVRSLHEAGFRVQLARADGPAATNPAAGAMAITGSVIRLHFDY